MSKLKIMALEGLENAADAAPTRGQPVEGQVLEGGAPEGTTAVASTTTPEASGSVAEREPNSPVADGDAIAIIEASVPEVTVEDGVLALEEAVDGVIAVQDSIEGAQEVIETIEGMNAQIATTVCEGGDGIARQEGEALRVAIEGFEDQLGYQGKSRWPSAENFGGVKSKVEGTKMALEHMNVLAKGGAVAVSIAQEGLIDKLKNGWDVFWSTEEKLLTRLEQVSIAFDKGTPNEGVIHNPVWGKALNGAGKPKVTAADVTHVLSMLEKATNSDKLADSMVKLAGICDGLKSAIRNSTFVSSDKAVEQINALHDQIKASLAEVMSEFPEENKGKDADFVPATAADKKRLVAQLTLALTNKKLSQASDKLELALIELGEEYWDRANTRLRGFSAQDLREVNDAATKADNFYGRALILMRANLRVCHSAIAYLGASVRKAS